MRRKLSIVVEDADDTGETFVIRMDGDTDRIGKIPSDKLGPAEFWALRLFGICLKTIEDAGKLKSMEHDDLKCNDPKCPDRKHREIH